MTDVEILRAAEAIIRKCEPTTEHEREVFRDTITGLVWARADLMIAAMQPPAHCPRCHCPCGDVTTCGCSDPTYPYYLTAPRS